MVQTLTPHKDGLALVLDRSLLDQLHIAEDTPLSIVVSGNSLIVTPAVDGKRREKFSSAMQDTFSKYDDVFRKLAE